MDGHLMAVLSVLNRLAHKYLHYLSRILIITVCVVYRNYLPIPDPLYSRYNIIAPCVVVVYNWGASIIIISEETAISRDIGITFNFHS